MKKKRLTKEEIAEKERQTLIKRTATTLRKALFRQCEEEGLRSVELKLEHLKKFPGTKLPEKLLTYEMTVGCHEEAIADFKYQKKKPQAIDLFS